MKTLTVVPAYGRDYKSADAVKADWNAQKDFRILHTTMYCGKGESDLLKADGFTRVKVRYDGLTEFCFIDL